MDDGGRTQHAAAADLASGLGGGGGGEPVVIAEPVPSEVPVVIAEPEASVRTGFCSGNTNTDAEPDIVCRNGYSNKTNKFEIVGAVIKSPRFPNGIFFV